MARKGSRGKKRAERQRSQQQQQKRKPSTLVPEELESLVGFNLTGLSKKQRRAMRRRQALTFTGGSNMHGGQERTPSVRQVRGAGGAEKRATGKKSGFKELRFSALAWLKLQWLYNKQGDEVGCMGITEPGDPLYVIDLGLPQQQVSGGAADFGDSLAAFNDEMAWEKGVCKESSPGANDGLTCVNRIWIHTHPGMSANPSGKDEQHFGASDGMAQPPWSVMFILGKDNEVYCRLQFSILPDHPVDRSLQVLLPVVWESDNMAAALAEISAKNLVAEWEADYQKKVKKISVRAIETTPTRHWSSYNENYGSGFRENRSETSSSSSTTSVATLTAKSEELTNKIAGLNNSLAAAAKEGNEIEVVNMLQTQLDKLKAEHDKCQSDLAAAQKAVDDSKSSPSAILPPTFWDGWLPIHSV